MSSADSKPDKATAMSRRRLIAVLLVAAALILIAMLSLKRLSFSMPDGAVKYRFAPVDAAVKAPKAPTYEGYAFLGWQSEDGEMLGPDSIPVTGKQSYAPVYIAALETEEHRQYIFPDRYGFYHPYDTMTRGEAAQMIYALLAAPVESSGNYADIEPTADYAQATSTLHYLCVTDELCFYPQEALRLGDLLSMLAAFYPETDSRYDIADVSTNNSKYRDYCLALEKSWVELDEKAMLKPETVMTRLDVCVLVNRVVGRQCFQQNEQGLDGLIPDMSPAAQGYEQLAEAALTHGYEVKDGTERHTDIPKFSRLEEGFRQIGADLYYVEADGVVLTDGDIGSLHFGSDGRYTSGNTELDALVGEVLQNTIDDSMDGLERLRAVYDYTVKHFDYQRQNALRRGSKGWEVEQAYMMLSTGKGNCYSYAATFCMLARAVGYDARAVSGTVDIINSAHGWVEIEIDGTNYLFDPELEMTSLYNRGVVLDRFMFTSDNTNGWTYTNGE